MKKMILAMSGASCVSLALKFLQEVCKHYECYVIVSEGAKCVYEKENQSSLCSSIESMGVKCYDPKQIWAGIASGSFGVELMAIIPTSMNTLAKIAYGISDDLISRCASVMLKENKTLLLAPREMPFSPIALENMYKLSKLGVLIAPPVYASYAKSSTLEELENFFVGKWLDLLKIPNTLYQRWREE